MIKMIPNMLTLGNLFCGSLAIISAVEGDFTRAFFLIIASAIFDFFDGFAARLLNAYSPIGADLDSLADLVSFGVAPAMIVYFMGLEHIGLLLALFAALRLAKFNVDTRQKDSFIGLPVPANALLFASMGYIVQTQESLLATFFTDSVVLCILTVLFSYLMVSEIPMFSLKFKSWGFKQNALVYTFLLVAFAAIVVFKIAAIPFVILAYVVVSILKSIFVKA
ncbi:MAG: CDP-diacylglycerol--serine O-phosphatidyltransferase [Rikenellaceae bacterium]